LRVVLRPATDEDLATRRSALRSEARGLLDEARMSPKWHEALRESITDKQRAAVRRIKDVWHRLPTYPDQVGGFEIYTAVIDDGVRSPEQFRGWLAEQGRLET
jgi:hypothetical protein